MADIEKEIHNKYFSRLYYFVFKYVKAEERVQDIVAASFIQLFDGTLPNDRAIKDFLYSSVQIGCENYYTETLGIPAPEVNDFFNSRLDAEFLAILYNEK